MGVISAYVVVIANCRRTQDFLVEGKRSAEQNGWMMAADVRKKYEV